MKISVDFSALEDIDQMLEAAREKPYRERGKALDRVANRVADQARANAGSYPHGTGRLREAVYVRGTPTTRFIGAPVREAFFLEFGSPNTGGPDPWLTGPARVGANELFEELGKLGDVF